MLESVQLPGVARTTTRLGFGCSGLMGGISEKESFLLLETAYQAGIRHFDVAPSYGHGLAERCLGRFLRDKLDVTITTKYGIKAPARAGILEIARTAVRPLVRRFPILRQQAAKTAAGLKSKAQFSAKEARRSLEDSLRELDVERIDFWLLHEPAPEDLEQSDLLPLLHDLQGEGKIGTYGVGAERGRVQAIWDSHREYCPVAQYEWSILDQQTNAFPGSFRIQHRVVSGALPALQTAMERDPEICRRWSETIAVDMSQTETCADLLINLALLRNPGGMVLFSSRNPRHIQTVAESVESAEWPARASRFDDLLHGQ